MSFLKSLWSDLVEKRLWPVALGLLVALVAVPVALGGGGGGPGVPLGPTGPTGTAAGTVAQVSLDPGAPVRRDRLGKVRDPFKQRAVEAAATGTTAPTGVTGGGGAPAGPTPDPAGGDPAPPKPDTTPAPKPETAPPAPPTPTFVVALRLGRVNAGRRARRNVEKLTPLPNSDSPFLVYLGVLDDAKTAVFLLSSDVTATGEGTCRPRTSSCETVELERGETAILAVTGADGKVRRHQLDVLGVRRSGTAPASDGVNARTVRGDVGTDLGTEAYDVDADTGLLRRVKTSADLGAHLPEEEGAAPTAGAALRSVRMWLPSGDGLDPMPEFVPDA